MSVGAQLRQAREARRLTIGDVSLQTKIQPWVLQALEADQLHQTSMSPIYARGFLSTYARFLRLDPAALLSQVTLRKDPLLEPAEPALATASSPAARPVPAPAPPAAAAPAPTPAPVVEPPAPAETAEEALAAPRRWKLPQWKVPELKAPEWKAPQWKLPEVQLPEWQIPWEQLERLRVPVLVLAAIAALVIVKPQRWLPKLPRMDAPHQQASVSVVQELPEVTPKPEAAQELRTVPVQGLELAITVRRPTWVQVRADGRLLTQQRLRRGAQETWHAAKRFEIVVAKPSQVDLNLNGESISPLAMAHGGRLLITSQGIRPLPDEHP